MNEQKNLDTLNDECFLEYIAVIHLYTGINIGPNRKVMVQGRLRKRIIEVGLFSYEEYLIHLRKSSEEKQIFIDLITTNDTHFFRTPRVWDLIEKKVIPQWYSQKPNQMFRAWSAAASSGEESYSLGILCREFQLRHRDFSFEILGTDISQEMISLCQTACYSGRSIEAFRRRDPNSFDKYLKPYQKNGDFQVIQEVRARTKFQCHNLFEKFKSKEKFDLILLRNILIYFNQSDQEKVLRNIRPHLKDDGILIIGESETLSHLKTDYEMIEPLIYRAVISTHKVGQ